MTSYLQTSNQHVFSTGTDYRIRSVESSSCCGSQRATYFDTIYFNGKYRFGIAKLPINPEMTGHISDIYQNSVTIYDGNTNDIVWNYDVKRKDASPLVCSCLRYFEKIKNVKGEKYLRERFKIPDNFALDTISIVIEDGGKYRSNYRTQADVLQSRSTGQNFHVNGMPSWGSLPPVICPFPMDLRLKMQLKNAREIGNEVICGRPCTIMRCDWAQGTRSYWIDPRTHIIMRSEGSDPTFPTGSGNFKSQYVRFDELKAVPNNVFALPPGTRVYLPELMWDYPLPTGLIRDKKQGPLKVLGFPLYPKA